MPLAYLVRNSHHAIEIGRRVIKADELKPLLDAAAVIRECETIVERTRLEAERQYAEARERGMEDGRRLGLERCADALAAIEAHAAACMATLDDTLIDLVIGVVRRIAPRIGADKLIAEWIEEAIPAMKYERSVRVRVHPSNLEGVRIRLAQKRAMHPMPELFELVEDAALDPFACVVESDCAVAKTDLGSRLAAARAAMSDCLGEEAA